MASKYFSNRWARLSAATTLAALLAVVTVFAVTDFQEKYEGELFGVSRESVRPGFLGGVAYANGLLYVAQGESRDLLVYEDETGPGEILTLQDAGDLVPNQLALVNVDVVTVSGTESKQALLVSDADANRVMAFELDGTRLFTMQLDWITNPTSPDDYQDDEWEAINGMSMTAGSKFILTDMGDGPSLAVQGTFAAGWAVGWGQRLPGALLVYRDQAFEFDEDAEQFTESAPFRELTNGGVTREAFGVAFDANNRLFLVDTFNFTITAYGADLALPLGGGEPPALFTFGNQSGGETESFTEPYGLAFWPDTSDAAGGRLFVADALNNRIVAYRLRADLLGLDPLFSIKLPQPREDGDPMAGQPYGVAVDPTTGKLAVSDDAVSEDGETSLYRVWVLQTRNLVAYNLETLDENDQVTNGVCAGEPYQIRFSLTVPRGWPAVDGATPLLTVAGEDVALVGQGPVDLGPLQTHPFTYSMVAPNEPTAPGDEVAVLASATAAEATDVLELKTWIEVKDCSAPPPTVMATPSIQPQLSGLTAVLPVMGNAFRFDVYLDAAVAEGDDAGIDQIYYVIDGASETGSDTHTVLNTADEGEPLPPVQRAVVTLRELGRTTITYRARSTKGVWSAERTYTVELVGVENRRNDEGDTVAFDVPWRDGYTYTVAGLPPGISYNETTHQIHGTLSFSSAAALPYTVTVTERIGVSATSWTFTWTVSNVNRSPVGNPDPPTATPTLYTTNEDVQLIISAANGVLANDTDQDGTPLTAGVASWPANGTLAFNLNGSFNYTPDANFHGQDSFSYWANDGATDGTNLSALTFVTLTVVPVNDAPTFVLGAAPTVAEDAGPQTIPGFVSSMIAGPANEAGQALTLSLAGNTNPALFSSVPALAANGTLTFQPAANVSGTAVITVRLQDDGGGATNFSQQTFTITVSGVNDAPSFVKGLDQTVAEDAAAQSIGNWATTISPGAGESATQTVSFAVSNDNTALFMTQPAVSATGTLTYQPAANAFGSATVTVRVQDNGGTTNGGIDTSAPQTFTITVTPLNDAPSFVLGAAPTVLEDAGAQTLAGWATSIVAGPANESTQNLTFAVTNNNAALFAVAPALSANGTLTYQPAANASGTATVTVQLSDDGGTPGVSTSAAQTFTIAVTGVNDIPTFTSAAAPITLNEDAGAQTLAAWATGMNAGPLESSQTLTFAVSNTNTVLFSVQPTVAANGTLSYTVAPNASGSATVTVVLNDNGDVLNGGVNASAPVTFAITVNPVNDAPTAAANNYSVIEGQTLTVVAPGILGNDGDVENSTLTAILVSGPSHGTLNLNPNGSFTYTPASGWTGPDAFTYVANDGSLSSTPVTVAISVNPSNLPPVCSATASPGLLWPPNHKPVDITLSGITDPDGGTPTIRFTSIVQDEPTNSAGQGNTMQDAGIGANGATAWVLPERTGTGDGRIYIISYTATDAANASCTGQVTVGVPHDQSGAPPVLSPGRWNSLTGQVITAPPAPVAVNDTATVAKSQSTIIPVLANDVANGSPLTVAIVSKPAKGTATVKPDGTIEYAAKKSTGTFSFTYSVTSVYGGTSTATVFVTVN